MKKIVLVFGLIAGLIVTTLMFFNIRAMYKNESAQGNIIVGYTTMVVAFSMIFVGIKNYRDKYNNGVISFGKAFKTGFYITLVASTLYVLVWLVEYKLFFPDFMDRYAACAMNDARSSGASQAELNEVAAEIARGKELYKNPLFVILMTYAEILPVGLIITLLSALLLKRKVKPMSPAV
ncbi:DUF4199 domain-containing protein [Pseudoflavitalea sp. X16]|uniref:DUF4199 domain-containing protein n=1 Tax=Paraflavitalea devenefica TaxID=2716334 RepID=UPI0014221B9C|nr:DUF4199 domain-containing protein [Paraflavitalea devenefica]NII26592.1 DUF4199 domain-containing protein [Paraflavitalea devenefica]